MIRNVSLTQRVAESIQYVRVYIAFNINMYFRKVTYSELSLFTSLFETHLQRNLVFILKASKMVEVRSL